MSVWELINHYVENGSDPLLNDFGGPFEPRRIRGGPAWIYSDLYTLDAKSSDPAVSGPDADVTSRAYRRILNGPMLQALIESRFRLKSHRENEQIPMFSLAVANGGLKLHPMEEGGTRSRCALPTVAGKGRIGPSTQGGRASIISRERSAP